MKDMKRVKEHLGAPVVWPALFISPLATNPAPAGPLDHARRAAGGEWRETIICLRSRDCGTDRFLPNFFDGLKYTLTTNNTKIHEINAEKEQMKIRVSECMRWRPHIFADSGFCFISCLGFFRAFRVFRGKKWLFSVFSVPLWWKIFCWFFLWKVLTEFKTGVMLVSIN